MQSQTAKSTTEHRWVDAFAIAAKSVIVGVILLATNVRAQTTELPWEFSPYRVEVWLAIDPKLGVSELGKSRLEKDLNDRLEMAFQAAWDFKVVRVEGGLQTLSLTKASSLTLETLEALDLVLAVPKKNPTTDSLRTVEAVVDKIAEIDCPESVVTELKKRLADADASKELGKLRDKLKPFAPSADQLVADVASGKVPVAVMTREKFAKKAESLRAIPLRFSWQMEALEKNLDKIFVVALTGVDDGLEVVVREFDCPTRTASPVFRLRPELKWDQLAWPLTNLVVSAFAPSVRIEDTQGNDTELRGRAFGLITRPDHPALVHVGDVLQPIVRRNDRNGMPSLLEPVPWTYVCVSEVNGVMLKGYALSGIRGGLQVRRNKRTQRLALRVRPLLNYTDLKIASPQAPDVPLSGCEVYAKQPGSDDLELLGRTDWRGILRLQRPAELPTLTIPPPVVTAAEPNAKTAAADSKDKPANTPPAGGEQTAAANATPSGSPEASSEAQKSSPAATENAGATEAKKDEAKPAEAPAPAEVPKSDVPPKLVPLRAPLWVLYVKNGDSLLARLPTVIGLQENVSADVANDWRRLEAEAFVRGVQSQIIDVVATRALLAARVRARIKSGKYDEAEKALSDLRSTRDYKKMADDLDMVQRKVLDTAKGPVPPVVQSRIDKMFQQTRDLLQKYLQDDLVRKLEKEVEEAKKGGAPPEEPKAS